MTQVVLICLAAVANVILNLSLKALMQQIEAPGLAAMAGRAPFSPWFWLAGVSGMALILLFMASIRSGSVAVAYIGVTSLAMIGLTIASALVYHDIPSVARISGLGLILIGLVLTLSN